MLKIFGILTLMVLSFSTYGQVFVGNVDINQADSVSVIEVFVDRSGWKDVSVFVDYGQKDNSVYNDLAAKRSDLRIVDPFTKYRIAFKSTAAVLNFLDQRGWDQMDSGISVRQGSISGTVFYFRKRK